MIDAGRCSHLNGTLGDDEIIAVREHHGVFLPDTIQCRLPVPIYTCGKHYMLLPSANEP